MVLWDESRIRASRGYLLIGRGARVGFAAAVVALTVASLGAVPGSALIALAAASLGGATYFVRSLSGAVYCILFVAAAASSGATWQGDFQAALGLAALAAVAGTFVVLPPLVRVRNIEEALQAQRRQGHTASTGMDESSEELDRARVGALAAKRALAQGSEIRRLAELRAIESLRIKDAFLATMSHELRTPLNQILGYSEILLEDSGDADAAQIHADVERINLAGRNLLEILDNTLDLSSIEAGKERLQMEELDLHGFLQELVDSMAAAARHRGNTLRLRCPEDIGGLQTDRVKLRKSLGALLSNACKFTHNGTVRVAVRRDPLAVRFEVTDTGIGISPDALDHLFEPFYQADGSVTRRHDGAGLGLTLCRHLTTMLGGEIDVESTPGKGSTFILQIPTEFKNPRAAGTVVMSISSSSPDAG